MNLELSEDFKHNMCKLIDKECKSYDDFVHHSSEKDQSIYVHEHISNLFLLKSFNEEIVYFNFYIRHNLDYKNVGSIYVIYQGSLVKDASVSVMSNKWEKVISIFKNMVKEKLLYYSLKKLT